MAENNSRFVIIDDVQISRERAKREGLIDDSGRVIKTAGVADTRNPAAEHGTRARGSKSARTKAAAGGDASSLEQGDDDEDEAAEEPVVDDGAAADAAAAVESATPAKAK